MIRLALAFLLLLAAGSARAACTLPYTLLNGTVADAGQVMANFNAVATCAGGSIASTTDLRNTPSNSASAIIRVDYEPGFGAPPELFVASVQPCSAAPAGKDDGISCVAASDGGSWRGQITKSVSVMDAGVGPGQTATTNSTNFNNASAAFDRAGIAVLNVCINAAPGAIVQINSVKVYGDMEGCQGATYKMQLDGTCGFCLQESPTAEPAVLENRQVTWSNVRCDQNQKQGTCFLAEGYAAGVQSMKSWNFKAVHLAATNAPGCVGAAGKGSISGDVMTVTTADERPYNLFEAGQILSDTLQSVAPGTTILSQISGVHGRAGDYRVSPSQTVPVSVDNNIVAGCWTHDDGLYAAGTYPSANMIVKGISNGLAGAYYVEIDQPSFLQPGFDPSLGPAAIVPGQGILLTTTAGKFFTRPNVARISGGNIQGYTIGVNVQYGGDVRVRTDVSENSLGVQMGGYIITNSFNSVGIDRSSVQELYCESTTTAPEAIGVYFGTNSHYGQASFDSCNAAAPIIDNSFSNGQNLALATKPNGTPAYDLVLTSPNTYQLTSPGLEYGWFRLFMTGAGGAGGGATASDATHNSVGVGGAGGGYISMLCYDPLQLHLPGAEVVVGAGGASVSGASGNPGASTTITDTLNLTRDWPGALTFVTRRTNTQPTTWAKPTINNSRGWLFGVTTAGTTGASEPNWDSVALGHFITDGSAVWQALGPTDWAPGMAVVYDVTTTLGTMIQPTVNNPLNYIFKATSTTTTGTTAPNFNSQVILGGILDGTSLMWQNVGDSFGTLRAGGGKGGDTLTVSGTSPARGIARLLNAGNLVTAFGRFRTCQTTENSIGQLGSTAELDYSSATGTYFGYSGSGGQAVSSIGAGAQGVPINGVDTQIGSFLSPISVWGAGGAGAVSVNNNSGGAQAGGVGGSGYFRYEAWAGAMTGRQ